MTNKERIANVKLVNKYDEFYDKVTVYYDCNLVEVKETDKQVIKIEEYKKYILHDYTRYYLGYYQNTDEEVFFRKTEMHITKVMTFEEVDSDTFEELRIFSIKNGQATQNTWLEVLLMITAILIGCLGLYMVFMLDSDAVSIGLIAIGFALFVLAQYKILIYVRTIYYDINKSRR